MQQSGKDQRTAVDLTEEADVVDLTGNDGNVEQVPQEECTASGMVSLESGKKEEDRFFVFRAVSLNARSMRNDSRIRELETEAGNEGWDVILVQETWRNEREEDFIGSTGHRWIGFGGPGRKHGVGILVHRRWSSKVTQVKELQQQRAAAIDIDCGSRLLRLVSAYFPHAGRPDREVEALYAAIEEDMEDAKRRKADIVIGGDFNAELGGRQQGEDSRIIGNHGGGSRNRRGEIMAKWAWRRKLTVANTMFAKKVSKTWTHSRLGRQRTIDCFCVAQSKRCMVQDVEVWRAVNMGSDHRAVRMMLQIRRKKGKRNGTGQERKQKSWLDGGPRMPTSILDNLRRSCQNGRKGQCHWQVSTQKRS